MVLQIVRILDNIDPLYPGSLIITSSNEVIDEERSLSNDTLLLLKLLFETEIMECSGVWELGILGFEAKV